MAASVDSLSIQITASTKAAKNNIDALTNSLVTLSSAIGALDVSKFDDLAASAKNLSEGLSGIKGVSARHIESVAKTLRKVAAESKETSACTALVVRNFQALSEVSSGFSNGMNQGANSVENMSAASENVGGSLSVINQNMNELAATGSNLAAIFEEVVDTMSRMQSILGDNQSGQLFIEDFNNAEYIDGTFREIENSVRNTSEGFARLAIEAKNAADSEARFAEEAGKYTASPLEEINAAMERVSNSVKNASSGMSWFKNMLAGMKVIIPTDSLDALNKKISNLVEKAQELQDRMNYKMSNDSSYKGSPELERDQKRIKGLISEIDRLMLKKQELESHGGFRLNFEGFSNVAKSISKANDKLKSFTSHLFRAKSASRDTAKSTDNFSLSANKLAKELLRVSKMLKLMVTRMALRAIIKEVGNGFKSLALHSAEFDNAMSGLINASKQLGYSFAGMVSPLINALAPALVYIINLAIKAVNVFNQLFSILSGKDTWDKAKSFTGKWSDEIKDANKQAKELKKTVLGFDELNQLQEKYTSGGDTSGNIEDMFDTVQVEQKWKNTLDNLLKPLKNAWANMGDEVVKAWSNAFAKIKQLGKDVARDFWKVWSQPETQKIFEDILSIIANIGDFVANIAEGLDEAWNKNETGLHILENIRDIVGIIVEGIKDITKSWADWAKEVDFSPLLEAVNEFLESVKEPAEAIMGIFKDLNEDFIQPLAKWLIETGIPELIGVFSDFNNKVQWDVIRERLDKVWKALEPFAETIGEGLILFMKDVSDVLASFFNSKRWDEFIDTLIKWMKNVKPEDVAKGIKVVAGAIITLKGALFLLEGIKGLATFVNTFSTFLALFKTGGTAATAAKTMKDVQTAIGGMTSAVEGWSRATSGLVGTGMFLQTLADLKDTIKLKSLKKELDDGSISLQTFTDKLKGLGGLGQSMGATHALDEYASKVNQLNQALESGTLTTQEYQHEMSNLNAQYKVQPTELTPLQKETRQLISDYAQGLITTTEYNKKLAELDAKYKTTADTTKSTSKTTTDSLGDISKAMDSLGSTYKDTGKTINSTSEDTKLEVHKMGFSVGNDLDGIKKAADEVKKAFDKKNWTFDGVAEGLKKTFEDAKRGIKDVWNSIADKLNGDYEIGEGTMHINLPHFYATGGFPEDGWFRASHGEMLGKFDNGQSVVANNQQITEGIARAVYSAMMSANSGNGGNIPVYTTIQIGEEQIARAVTKGQRKIDRRYSPTTT